MNALTIPLLGHEPRFYLETQVSPADLLLSRRESVVTTPEIDRALKTNAVVVLSLSGGKDGAAAALATNRYLDQIGHTGPRAVSHADLGRVEHSEAMVMVQKLADRLGLPLHVARREKGDLLDRFLQRWHDNVERYINLECVQLVCMWPSSGMLYCRSEVKVSPQLRQLVRLYPGQQILNVVGIRAEESKARAKQPISKPQPLLKSATYGTTGLNWNPIHDWTLADVLAVHEREQFPLADHYTVWGADRFSCKFCCLGSTISWEASIANEESHDHYRDLVDLEITSCFGMTERRWLCDLRPELLLPHVREQIPIAKAKAAKRMAFEARIPKHLLYDKQGWPTCMPTYDEAAALAEVRAEVGALMNMPVRYLSAEAVRDRFALLLAEKERREAKKARREERGQEKGVLCTI